MPMPFRRVFVRALADIEPAELAGTVMKAAVERSGADPHAINCVTVGNTIPTKARFAYVACLASIQAVKSTKKGDVTFDTDEHVKASTTMETLAKMKRAFK
jgi:acetyl-CoA acetyltransferase